MRERLHDIFKFSEPRGKLFSGAIRSDKLNYKHKFILEDEIKEKNRSDDFDCKVSLLENIK